MGNYVSHNCSCACMTAMPPVDVAADQKRKQLEKMITVVHPAEQRVVELGGDGAPTTVAELMLEFPGHFAVAWEADEAPNPLHVKRAIALPADQEASPGGIYILFPMHRLHTRIAPHEGASCRLLLSSHLHRHLRADAGTLSKKKSLHSLMQASSAKVAPLSAADSQEPGEQETAPSPIRASHQPPGGDGDCQGEEDEIDLLLQQFCSARPDGGSLLSKSGSLVRSKSWIPRLQPIDESSILVL